MTTPNDLPSVGTEDARDIAQMTEHGRNLALSLASDIESDGCCAHRKETINLLRDLVSERDELASRVRELEGERDDRFYGRIDLKIGAVRVSRIVTEPQCRQARDLRQGLIIEATIAIDAALNASKEHP